MFVDETLKHLTLFCVAFLVGLGIRDCQAEHEATPCPCPPAQVEGER
jgi:hypothetical protein